MSSDPSDASVEPQPTLGVPANPWEDETFPWRDRPAPPVPPGGVVDDPDAPSSWKKFPHAPPPVVIEIVIQLKKWEVVATGGKEVLKFDGTLELYWTDYRLKGFPTANLPMPPDIWRPSVFANAGFNLGAAEKYEQLPTFKYRGDDPEKSSDGTLCMDVKMNLTDDGFDISGDVDRFRSFPFDSTRVDLSILFIKGSRPEFDRDVRLSLRRPHLNAAMVEKYNSRYQQIDMNGMSKHSNDYNLEGISFAVGANDPPGQHTKNRVAYEEGCKTNILFLSFHIGRSYTFYVQNGLKPMYTIALFGFVGYAVEPSDLSNRVALNAVLFLSIYAVNQLSVGHIPRLPFKTVMDSVSESVSIVLMMILIGACVSYHVARPTRDCEEDCDFDDALADRVDMVCGIVVLVYVLIYSVAYRTVYAAWKANKTSGSARPWKQGTYLRNRWKPTEEAYHLKVDEAFVTKYGKKYLGVGVKVPDAEEKW